MKSSEKRKILDKLKKEKLLDLEHEAMLEEKMNDILDKKEDEIQNMKNEIKSSFLFNDGSQDILMFFS